MACGADWIMVPGMALQEYLESTAELGAPALLDGIRKNLDPAWIDEALAATGTATVRRRRLPAEQVIWLVVGMALYRHDSIQEIVSKLGLALPDRKSATVAPSAIPKARRRLGEEPLQLLFEKTGREWARRSADQHRWRGLAVYGFDGTSLRTPDTQENLNTFGRTNSRRGESAFPTIRLVALQALRSHLIAATSFGGFNDVSEIELAEQLYDQIPDDSVTIVDRNFVNARALIPLMEGGTNRHWIVRKRSNMRMKKLEHVADGEWIVEMNVSRELLAKNPMLPKTWRGRAILWAPQGKQARYYLTSLLDHEKFPAQEIVEMYRERWEIELGFGEIKTTMLDSEPTLRSKSPEGIRQELWGILLTYNMVRVEMEAVADEAGVEPTRISFVQSMRQIQHELWWISFDSAGTIPKRLKRLREELKRYILPPRRSERSYERAVKIKMSNYPRKRSKLKRKAAK